jgi:alpha-tubulin suppressor-like RCC1 family protein
LNGNKQSGMKNFTKVCWMVLVVMLITFEGKAQNLQISGGNNFSAALCSNGLIYAWGDNSAGQLGRNASNVKYPEAFSATPRPIYLPAGNTLTMKQVDAGSGNTGIALACDGSVWTWGGNCGNGNIGIGSDGGSCSGSPVDGTNYYSSMQRVVGGAQGGAFLTNITYINASTRTSFAVEATTGRVLAWGNNADGDLGNGATGSGTPWTPSYVLTAAGTPLTNIKMVEGTDYGAYALSNDGYVYSWGGNSNQDLGRAIAGDQYFAKRVRAYNHTTNTIGGDLSNIVKITGGDTHGLAIDSDGNLWSWGGDWGPGQRGWGATGTALPYATRVVAPGTACAFEQWKIGPWITDVIEISAGQKHSIALMGDGRVVTFGANDHGQLGVGSTTSFGCPQYVKTAAATDLTSIVAVSDGDYWSFALTSSGSVYVWGENDAGEIGLAGSDRTYATLNPAIPTACGGSLLPCPIAYLGADVLKCPGTSEVLMAGTYGDTYIYNWFSGPTATGPWTPILPANRTYASGGSTITVTTPQFYRVVTTDNRAYVADKCGPCTATEDVMQLIDRTPPVATGSAGTCATSVCFDITSTGAVDNDAFDWYATQVSATKLNTSGTVNPFCTAKSNLTLNGGNWEIWVEDKRTFQANVGAPTAPCTPPAGKASGSNHYQELVVYDNSITLNTVQVYFQSDYDDGGTYSIIVTVWPNDPNKNSTSKDGPTTPVLQTATIPGFVETNTLGGNPWELKTVTGIGLTLTGSAAGTKYWVRVTVAGGGQLGTFACGANPAYPLSDTDPARDHVVMKGFSSGNEVEQLTYKAPALNWGFTYTDGYPCGRFKLTAPDATTSCLPVDFLEFSGENKGRTNVLYWATSFEENSDYFEVQRSYDGENWITVGVVDAAGNSSIIQEYTFTDASSKNGIAYYRIVEKDFDGATTVSSAISLTTTSGGNISVHPNPNNGQFTIETNGVLGDHTSIQLLDALGRIVYQSSENFSFKSVSKELSLTDLENGMYFLNISDGSYSSSQKLIVE